MKEQITTETKYELAPLLEYLKTETAAEIAKYLDAAMFEYSRLYMLDDEKCGRDDLAVCCIETLRGLRDIFYRMASPEQIKKIA